jgi:RES domain-containing protein
MLIWRLASARRAREFDGGYGIHNDGRWNTRGRPVTYGATVPSLAALEKRVHVADPALLPPQVMVAYEAPDNLPCRTIGLDELPAEWTALQSHTQTLGDEWLDAGAETLLIVPSAVLPLANASDRNVLINHRAAGAQSIRIAAVEPFTLDPRLFRP